MSVELPQIGETLAGRYELLDELGEGGMSVVFRARDRETGAELALKLLTPRYLGRPEREQRLLDEARYLERLRGRPGIVSLVDHGRLEDRDGWPYLVTELLDGRPLNWLLIKHKFTPVELREVARGIAAALATCHAAGVVHRDLTPTNVFVSLEPIRVKLFDFSHAASLDAPRADASELERLTGIFDVPGTSGYMGPEQASSAPADPTMDVFSFGVLLYELITGRNPYPKVSHGQFIELQRAGSLEPPRLQAWIYKVGPGWAELIRDCTLDEPKRRPSAAGIVARLDRLEPAAAGEERTTRMDAEEVARLQAGVRAGQSSAGEPVPTAEMIGAWGPPPTAVMAPESLPASASSSSSSAELGSGVGLEQPAAEHGSGVGLEQPAGETDDESTEEHEGPTEVYARPAFARPDAAPVVFAPAADDGHEAESRDEDEDEDENEDATLIRDEAPPPLRSSSLRRWWPGLLVLAVVGLGLVAWAYVGRSAEDRPDTGEELETEGSSDLLERAPTSTEPLADLGPEVDVEVAETGGEEPEWEPPQPERNPKPTHKRQHEGKDESDGEPEPRQDPEPAPPTEAKPDCAGVVEAAEQAHERRDWSAVIQHTANKRCWPSNQARLRLRLRVEALAQAKRWQDCLDAAKDQDDPKLTRWVNFCSKNL